MSLKVYGLTELSVRCQKLGKDVLSYLNNVELNYQLSLLQETDHMYYKNNLPLLVSQCQLNADVYSLLLFMSMESPRDVINAAIA